MAQNQGPKSDFERPTSGSHTAIPQPSKTALPSGEKKTSNLELERGAPQIQTKAGFMNTGSGLLCKIFK